ncbi:hypothetical protein BAUCODRAFT_482523 [Baudoinia panamericana UAMH 10762]|uniref:Aminotransferase class V domain-containing protein n=1 Tax=Baudoinia panamericana (strain UAMH 10762) TaxID=717646 RepID=M2MYE5_BAUPA|nr:uncharacterized protein BAUCODRAFT_482523 [Baudoinia panamericana UAMH 10762]EMC96603.1 hypothetical protein BAUCODRAFT_482523 [Baudoinia panamericana UAMH 10762]
MARPTQASTIECGRDAAKHFSFASGYCNLNHGSFGSYPLAVRDVLRHYQDEAEAKPDTFIRYDYPKLLDKSREALANYLNAPLSSIVLLSNATTGINTVLRSLVYKPNEVIIYFATIYGACEKTVEYITETTPASSHKISYTYPIPDDDLLSRFEHAISTIQSNGQTPKLAIFDTIVSLPGVRMPFARLTQLCKRHNILSCIDGAHGIGQIPLDLTALDPDFFVSNCHKWLHVPRGCAGFYVPERNQHLIRSTLPTSHGFIPVPRDGAVINNPLPPGSGKSAFVTNFEFVGTLDNSPYLCIPAALRWRSRLCWQGKQGEEAITAYTQHLAREAGGVVSGVLGTEVMENAEGTLGECNFSNVRLPISFVAHASSDPNQAVKIGHWIAKVLTEEYNTFIAIIFYAEAWWVRLSSQVYLTIADFEWGGKVLQEVCQRVRKGEWQGRESSKL